MKLLLYSTFISGNLIRYILHTNIFIKIQEYSILISLCPCQFYYSFVNEVAYLDNLNPCVISSFFFLLVCESKRCFLFLQAVRVPDLSRWQAKINFCFIEQLWVKIFHHTNEVIVIKVIDLKPMCILYLQMSTAILRVATGKYNYFPFAFLNHGELYK